MRSLLIAAVLCALSGAQAVANESWPRLRHQCELNALVVTSACAPRSSECPRDAERTRKACIAAIDARQRRAVAAAHRQAAPQPPAAGNEPLVRALRDARLHCQMNTALLNATCTSAECIRQAEAQRVSCLAGVDAQERQAGLAPPPSNEALERAVMDARLHCQMNAALVAAACGNTECYRRAEYQKASCLAGVNAQPR